MTATIKDIAKLTGYSVSTVSKVLNKSDVCFAKEETRKKITSAAEELGYEPNFYARGLRGKESFIIGIAGGFFGAEIVSSQMREILNSQDLEKYIILMADTKGEPDEERRIIDEFRKKQVDAIILRTTASLRDEMYLSKVLPENIPSLVISSSRCSGVPSVYINHEKAMELAVDRLVELGHRRPALLTSIILNNREKFSGFRNGAVKHGIYDESRVMQLYSEELPDLNTCSSELAKCQSYESGDAWNYIMSNSEKFSGIDVLFCNSDQIALEAMRAFNELGIMVPEDISVVGFDDIAQCKFMTPSLSTIRQPQKQSARAAVKMLMDLMAGEKVEPSVFVPQFVQRESIKDRKQ